MPIKLLAAVTASAAGPGLHRPAESAESTRRRPRAMRATGKTKTAKREDRRWQGAATPPGHSGATAPPRPTRRRWRRTAQDEWPPRNSRGRKAEAASKPCRRSAKQDRADGEGQRQGKTAAKKPSRRQAMTEDAAVAGRPPRAGAASVRVRRSSAHRADRLPRRRQDHAAQPLAAATRRWPSTAVIINEFGEIGLDHLLVKTIDDDMVLLQSGCLCCTLRGDLGHRAGASAARPRQRARDVPPA